MNLVADESVDHPIVERLRQEGHDVVYVAELQPGISDDQVLQEANQRSALLVTADKDFGDLVFRMRRVNAGIVLIRLAGLSATAKADIVVAVLRDHATELAGAFSVVSPGGVRIRPAP
jgi:predicted nuclease of predicted toxin-antitoxin system